MTAGTAVVLLSFGIGALVVAGRSAGRSPRHGSTLRQRADDLREQTLREQETSARVSRSARELMDQWSAAEDAAQKAGL